MDIREIAADLPIAPLLPELQSALRGGTSLVLQAPPGAGKTTLVPLALLGEPWLGRRRIVMLEPRRLAARAAAKRMSELLHERVGETVGYRVRLDSAVGPKTRIEVVTAGVFIRQIQDDPSLEGVGAVLFDEFHERSLDVDLGLALALDARAALREDLRLVAMSATLEGAPIARLLNPDTPAGAPILTSEGKRYPVETIYLARDATGRLDEVVTSGIRRAVAETSQDLLVFLPGVGDIRRVQARLEDLALPAVDVMPLYSDLSLDKQDAAIRPSPAGRRKIVLATSIAETSLTIEGVRAVVDSGYTRRPRFDPGTGMSSLETVRVSRASADQRRGRAGRTGPGTCYRLWTEAADRALIPQTPAEILDADLAPLALELAAWGNSDVSGLSWLDSPPGPAVASARELLQRLGALEVRGAITPEGRRMAGFGVHPRLAHLLLRGQALGIGTLAADIAALLGERDILRDGPRDVDLRHRVDMLQTRSRNAQPVAQVAAHWRRQLGVPATGRSDGDEDIGRLVALAYPDRVAQRRAGTRGQFRLSNGRGALLPETDPLAGSDFLAVATLDGSGPAARIFLAAPLRERDLRELFADDIRDVEFVAWDSRDEAVRARRQRKLGELVLEDRPFDAPADQIAAAMLAGIRELGLAALPWTGEVRNLQARVEVLRRIEGTTWPDLSDTALLATLDDWLGPFLGGVTRRAHLANVDLGQALRALLSWDQQQALARKAPTHIVVPSGSRLPIDYSTGEPKLSVRLQEMFGLTETPTVCDGRVPVMLHLLSPAGRPVQITRDLASFWSGTYREVKRDLRGQYPKHHWPDDPLTAIPTRRAKRRGE
jgi:ATP-dependent helicase HrpB